MLKNLYNLTLGSDMYVGRPTLNTAPEVWGNFKEKDLSMCDTVSKRLNGRGLGWRSSLGLRENLFHILTRVCLHFIAQN